jgi:hypothetical protein
MSLDWTTLRYCDGYMLHAPTVGGRVEMTLFRDGQVRVSNLPAQRRTPQVFEARVAPWAIEAITAGLSEAGFPVFPVHAFPVGTRVTLLSLAASDRIVQVWVSREHRRERPALDRAMRTLEAIAHAASHGSLGESCTFERPLLV